METKTCSKCVKTKPFSEFVKDKRAKTGLSSLCLACARIRNSKWRNENKEKVDSCRAAYVERNYEKELERQRDKSRKARELNYGKVQESVLKWRLKNKDKCLEMSRRATKKRRLLHKEEVNEAGRKWGKKAREILSDKYVSDLLTQRTSLKRIDIPSEIIDLKRAQLQIHRSTKQLLQTIKEKQHDD